MVKVWQCKVKGGGLMCSNDECKPTEELNLVNNTRYQATIKIRSIGGNWESVTNGIMEGDAKTIAQILHSIADDLEERHGI